LKIIIRIILIAALAALGVWLWTVFFPSPQKIIRQQLAGLAADISFSQSQNDLVKMARAQNVASFFAGNVTVNVTVTGYDQQTVMDHDEITQAMLASRQRATDIDLKFPDVNVTVAPDKTSATADVTVDATVSGERNAILQEMKFTFEKTDGHWLINRVETVQVVTP
jgi:hypothetical protein